MTVVFDGKVADVEGSSTVECSHGWQNCWKSFALKEKDNKNFQARRRIPRAISALVIAPLF
jgi:hypothetical protein